MKSNCPCINCITLGMCKAAIKPNLNYGIDIKLSERCSIFKEFYTDKNLFIDLDEWQVLLDLFVPDRIINSYQ